MAFKRQRIRDPLHNLIEFQADEFESVMWRVIQTPPFQRLRRVKQLGFSEFVYPGATHTRFAHSVGVFTTARQLVNVIKVHLGGNRFESSRANMCLAAALVHDLGHGPFSHAFEDVGRRFNLKMASHERLSDILIRNSEVSGVLKDLGSGFASDVADVIGSAGPKNIFGAVVSSQFDADRLDYMRRDRLMTGTHHGGIDFDRLLSNMKWRSLGWRRRGEPWNLGDLCTWPEGNLCGGKLSPGAIPPLPDCLFPQSDPRSRKAIFPEILMSRH